MKNQLSTFTIFFFALLVSCTNDNEPVIINKSSIDSDVISAKSIATDTSYISYMTYIHQLEQNFEGKTIYHNYNRPDFSKEIEHLKSINSKEIETPAFSANTRISNGISFVHGEEMVVPLLMHQQPYLVMRHGKKSLL